MLFASSHPAAQSPARPIFFSVIALFAVFAGGSAVHAQVGSIDSTGTGGRHTIKGRVFFPSGRTADLSARVRLESLNSQNLLVIIGPTGEFVFKNLSPGSYAVVVDAGDEYETARESVYIDGETSLRPVVARSLAPPRAFTVPIYLRAKSFRPNGRELAKPGVIDAASLGVPQPALSLYIKGVDAARAGETQKAVEQLRQAVALHAAFPAALNELGVQYLKLAQPDKAVETLKAAVKLTPDSFETRLSYGIALLNKNDFNGAQQNLEWAAAKNDSSFAAHMYLGIALAKLKKLDEAEKELRRSISLGRSDVGIAHKYLGGIYWARRDYERAADELEQYIKLMPKAPDADRARESIKELRSRK